MGSRAEIHDRVLAAGTVGELMQAYQDWAAEYDHDLTKEWGYRAPADVAELVAASVTDRQGRVLDAGCGTGLVGLMLKDKGFAHIDGADYSQGMLDQAADKQVYENLVQIDLNSRTDIPDDSYDVVTCVGTFTSAHVRPEALSELVRVARAGGLVCFTVRDSYWDETQFARTVLDLELAGRARIRELRTTLYIETEGSTCKIVLLDVL